MHNGSAMNMLMLEVLRLLSAIPFMMLQCSVHVDAAGNVVDLCWC